MGARTNTSGSTFNYIQEQFPDRFKTWQLLDHGKVFVKGMERLGIYTMWKDMMEECTNLLGLRV